MRSMSHTNKAGRDLDGKKYDGLPSRVELPVLDKCRRLAAIAEIEAVYPLAPTGNEPSLFPDE